MHNKIQEKKKDLISLETLYRNISVHHSIVIPRFYSDFPWTLRFTVLDLMSESWLSFQV